MRFPGRRVLAGILAAVAILALQNPAAGQTGREIMQKQRDLQRASDEEEAVTMKLVSKSGEVKQRRIATYALTLRDDLSKTLIRFLTPRDLENTGLLTWEGKDGNDDQWLYLPATRKVKRIASSGKKNRFMGTDFAYEDLRPESLRLHEYELVGSEIIDGADCFIVEAVPGTPRQAADTGYSKRRVWIRKDNHFTVKQEYYDKKGKLEKVATARKLVQVKGTLWRANEVEMRDLQAGTRTVMLTEHRALDRGLSESFFTEAQLTRGAS